MSDGNNPWVVVIIGQDGSMYAHRSRGCGSSERWWDIVVDVHRVIGTGAHYGVIYWRIHRGNVTQNEVGMTMEEDGM
jgi:hypothetical protein